MRKNKPKKPTANWAKHLLPMDESDLFIGNKFTGKPVFIEPHFSKKNEFVIGRFRNGESH